MTGAEWTVLVVMTLTFPRRPMAPVGRVIGSKAVSEACEGGARQGIHDFQP